MEKMNRHSLSHVGLALVLPALTTEVQLRIFKTGTAGSAQCSIYKYTLIATIDIFYN